MGTLNCRCGEPVEFVKRWTGSWVICDRKPDEYAPETFVEVEMGEFVSVFRHKCQESANEAFQRRKYEPLNRVFLRGKKRNEPTSGTGSSQPSLRTDRGSL